MESLWTARLRSFYGGKGNAQKCVFTTFGGRSTVVKSSFGGTILEIIQMPFFFFENFILGGRVASADILRVRGIERASWRLVGDGVLCARARDIDREERINHTRCFLCISGDPGEEEKNLRKCVAPPHRLVTSSMKHFNCLGRKAPAERIVQTVSIGSLVFGQKAERPDNLSF